MLLRLDNRPNQKEVISVGEVITATYDGKVLKPDRPLNIKPNTKVKVTLLDVEPPTNNDRGKSVSSVFDIFANANLDGPEDASENLDKYMYGDPGKAHGSNGLP